MTDPQAGELAMAREMELEARARRNWEGRRQAAGAATSITSGEASLLVILVDADRRIAYGTSFTKFSWQPHMEGKEHAVALSITGTAKISGKHLRGTARSGSKVTCHSETPA
jgi:hypothetical protein